MGVHNLMSLKHGKDDAFLLKKGLLYFGKIICHMDIGNDGHIFYLKMKNLLHFKKFQCIKVVIPFVC